jgi:ABC-type amino acid transport substrate-binding protein
MKRFLAAAALAALAANPALAAEPTGTLKKIKDTGTIVLGHRDSSPPFSFVAGDGKPAGYSVDVCTRVANSIQRQLGLQRLDIKWVKVAVDTRIPAVVDGTIDLECGSTTATLGRHEQVDFSFITFVDGGGLLATRASGIRGVGDLGGKKVAVIPGTTTEGALTAATRKAMVSPTVIAVKDHAEGLVAVEGGRADAYVSDRVLLVGLIVSSGSADKLGVSDDMLSYEPYAFMLRRNDADFRLAVNRALAALYRSGEIGPIYEKWFAALGKPGGLLVAAYLLQSLPE